MNKLKVVALFSILICLLIVVPMGFAVDNQTAIDMGNDIQDNLSADYYFDANIENDTGNGSIDNPYKTLTPDRIKSDSIIHLAKGEYDLTKDVNLDNVNIVGQNPQNTVIKYVSTGNALSIHNSCILTNLTLINLHITNYASFTANNVIFNGANSNQGGAINTYDEKLNTQLNLDNCTFINNHADYGGAIFLGKCNASINNCVFIDNYAKLYGGAIATEIESNITIRKSKFINDYSVNDAGGALFVYAALNFTVQDLEIDNCSATFGGAIVSLMSFTNLENISLTNNKAKYCGGGIYAMYRTLSIVDSVFNNNSADTGGAVCADGVEIFTISSNRFINNNASSIAGAVYSLLSDTYGYSILKDLNNSFTNNSAAFENDVYQTDFVNMTIGNSNYTLIQYNSSYNGTLPSKFDLRELGYVSPVKDQGKNGNCWAFSALSSLESCVLKATGMTYDFSESNMKNLMAVFSDYGWDMATNYGGYDKMGVAYLTSWLGPINENDDKYFVGNVLSPVLNSLFHIQNVLYISRSNITSTAEIKKALMDYGAVATSLYSDSNYRKGNSYYYAGNNGANHAVAIVGWDDNYSKSNFKNTPPGDGAWIAKNSWGENWGDHGYFYVSYYDTKFAPCNRSESIYTFIFNDSIKFDKNYQYDIPGKTDYFFNTTNTVWYKNKFISTDDEYLAAVSTYFAKETDWNLLIYVNDVLKVNKSGKAHPSYSTINLDQFIPLKTEDVFEIVFKITVDGDAGVPISEYISLNKELYTEDISFLSYDGVNWDDFYYVEWTYPDHSYYSQVACIKAFTVLDRINTTLSLNVTSRYNPVEITATVRNCYGNLVNGGTVVFNVEGVSIPVDVKNGVAKLTYLFKNIENNSIHAEFSASGYASSESSFTFDVAQVKIIADDFVTYFDDTFTYHATLVDDSLNPVAGKEIKFSVANKDYLVKTNNKGQASIELNLDVGNHEVKIGFNDSSKNTYLNLVRKITIESSIILPDIVKYTLNSKYMATLVDSKGNLLKNRDVTLIINSKSYRLTTDSKGILEYNIDLSVGSYKLDIVNNVTGEVKSQTINVVARLNSNNDVVMYYSGNESYKVRAYDDYGNVAKNVEVTFGINGEYYTEFSDDDGYAYFRISLDPNTYTINATYNGFVVSNRIVVKSTIALPSAVKYTLNSKYKVTLYDNKGNLLKNTKVSIIIKSKAYDIATDSNGVLNYNIGFSAGSYKLDIVNNATGEVKSQTINVVARLNSNKNIVMYYGAGTYYKVRAYDDNGNVAKNVIVVIKVNGRSYSRYTDQNGYASLRIGLSPNTYTITATYRGYTVSNKIVVKPTLILYTKTVKRSQTFKYTVKLLNSKGNILKYKKVTVKFRGKTYTAVTNYAGIATFKIKSLSAVGKFTLIANYGTTKVSKVITVKR